MTRQNYLVRAQQLCHLVNVRRIQVGREPLTQARLMRTVRRCIGPEPREPYPYHENQSWFWDQQIPYVLTRKALNYLIAQQGDT